MTVSNSVCGTVRTQGSLVPPKEPLESFKLPSCCRVPRVTHKTPRLTKGGGRSEQMGESKEGDRFVSLLFRFHRVKKETIQTDNEAKVTCRDSGHQQEQRHNRVWKCQPAPRALVAGPVVSRRLFCVNRGIKESQRKCCTYCCCLHVLCRRPA